MFCSFTKIICVQKKSTKKLIKLNPEGKLSVVIITQWKLICSFNDVFNNGLPLMALGAQSNYFKFLRMVRERVSIALVGLWKNCHYRLG